MITVGNFIHDSKKRKTTVDREEQGHSLETEHVFLLLIVGRDLDGRLREADRLFALEEVQGL